MHRGIIDYAPPLHLSRTQIELEVRKNVKSIYSPTWARGFAFGAVIQFSSSPDYLLNTFAHCVDGINRSKGVWQWIIAIDHHTHTAYGAHMWMRGSLHPMFDATVTNLTELGYQVQTEYLVKPRLFRSIDSYFNFVPKAIGFLKKLQLLTLAILVIFLSYSYFK